MPLDAPRIVKLSRPADFDILEALSDGERDVARNLQHKIEASRAHINNRLPQLADYGLVEKVGPADNSGLYRITSRGVAAARLREEYDSGDRFEQLVKDKAGRIRVEPAKVVDES